MTTTTIEINSTEYVEFANLAITDFLVTTNGTKPVSVVFAAAQPAATVVGHVLRSGESGLEKRDSFPTSSAWGIVLNTPAGSIQDLAVST